MKHFLKTLIFVFVSFSIFTQAQTAKKPSVKWSNALFDYKVFIENKGQFDGKDGKQNSVILYGVDNTSSHGYQAYFTQKGMSYRMDEWGKSEEDKLKLEEYKQKEKKINSDGSKTLSSEEIKEEYELKKLDILKTTIINIEWIGSNTNVHILPEDLDQEYFNYPDIFNPSKSVYYARSYKSITYKNLYPNIDLTYSFLSDKKGIKYAFTLHPGANPEIIKMKYEGANNISLDNQGNIHITTSFGDFIDHAPFTFYQENKQEIKSMFILNGTEIKFRLNDSYDNSKTVILDPWTTNPNYTPTNRGFDIETDASGNAYAYGGHSPAALRKYSSVGVALWTTNVLAPSYTNWHGDLATDNAGNSYGSNGFANGMIQKINNAGIVAATANNISFVTGAFATWEFFNLCFNKAQTQLIGGGQAGGHGMGEISQTTCYALNFNSMASFASSEIRGVCASENGNYYGITISNGSGGRVFGFTPAFGVLWNVSSGYNNTNHGYSTPNAFNQPSAQNCIAASKCYVYTYNGDTLKKRNISNGAFVASIKVANGSPGGNSGVLVDSCENVYVGTTTGISKYDSNLNFVTSGNTSGAVYDIVFSKINTEILATGNAIVEAVDGLVDPCPQASLTINTFTAPEYCNQANGSATVSASGGISPYTYTWMPSAQTGSVANGLSAGIYTVIVKDNSCNPLIKTATVSIINIPAGTVSITSSTNVACNGGNTGAATATINGGTGPFNYLWSNTQATTTATNLSAGNYTITVTDSKNCVSTATVAITQPPLLTSTVSNINVLCNGATTASANVNASGGTGAYSYTWSNNQNTQSITNLGAGNYSIIVKDANGCTTTQTLTISQPPALTLNVNTTTPSVCVGNIITLVANALGGAGGYGYSWASGPTTSTYSVNQPVGNYVYTVTSTDANNCNITNTIAVSFIANPTVTAVSATACAGQNATLTANGAGTYTWTPSGFIGANFITNQPAGTYNYTVLGAAGTCTSSNTATLTVHALPTPTAQVNSPVCAGEIVTFTGLGGLTYTWTGPGAYNSTNQNPVIATSSVANTGNYSLSVTDANGCTNNTNVSLTVNALPVIAVNNPAVCLNDNINLTSNGGVSYDWSGPLGFTDNQQNPVITNATIPMSGQYTVTVTSAQGCTNTAVANVTVYALPNPAINSNAPVCVGNSLNLSGSGGASYSWIGPNGFVSNLQNPSISNVSINAVGIYSLVVSAGSCSASTTATILINPLPVIAFTNTHVACHNGNTGASSSSVSVGTGPFNYQWSNGQTSQEANNLAFGTYTLTVTDANGCINSAVTQINQPGPLSMAINSSAPYACVNSSISLNGLAGGGAGGYNYSWTPGPTGSNYNVSESISGTYHYSLTATDQNGCNITRTISLIFHPQPTVTVNSATICLGQTVTLTANGASTYTWMPGNITGNAYTYSGTSGVGLTVIGSANGCTNQTAAHIVVNPLPVANVVTNSKTGCAPACLTFSCNTTSSTQSVDWNFEDGYSTGNSLVTDHCYKMPGDYKITVDIVDVFGCKTSATYTVGVYPKPIADFNFSPLKPLVNSGEVDFTDASYNAKVVKWDWYFMNKPKPHSNQQNPAYMYTEAGTYAIALVVQSDFGCIDTVLKTIVVGEDYGVYVPNAFTPNGDGVNDVFQPKGFGITVYEFVIFDRWGEKLFSTNNFEQGWDGTYKGQMCKDDAYIWKINLTNVFGKSHELSGHVTLMK